MEIASLCVNIVRVHPESSKLQFDTSVIVKSYRTGTKKYNLSQIIDKNEFEDLFHMLLSNAEDQIRNTILMENASKALKHECSHGG